VVRSVCRQHDQRDVLLEAESGVLRAELHEVSAERDELLAERARLRPPATGCRRDVMAF